MRIPTTRGPLRRLGLVAVLAAALGGLTATPALAHTQLVSSTPGKGASAAAVTEVKLVFSDEISNAKVIVKDAHGKAFQSGAAEHKGTTVTQKLTGALPAGSYTVAYRVVGADGHPVQADGLTFTATAAQEVLSFLSQGTPSGDPPIALLTDVSITKVPEPGTLTVLGAGLAGLMAVRRRRNGRQRLP